MQYYILIICEQVLFGKWVVPLASVPGNILQNVVGIVIAILVCVLLKKTLLLNKFTNNNFEFI